MLALLPDAETLRTLGVLEHVEKPINLLSSGELRRMQLARMLMSSPEVLIVDNPYIGLDVSARCMLTSVLELLAQRLTLVLVVSRPDDIPPFVQSTVTVQQKRVGEKQPLVQFMEQQPGDVSATFPEMALPWRDEQQPDTTCSNVIDFHNINIRYGARTILSDLNWTVRRGEHWALTGENGSGKSTLLSLVCADNPQGYACNIRLFGHQRGKGESIWDIKRHIGYVSPEIFSTYRKTLPALDIVASGLHDTIGLYKHPTNEERRYCQQWLDVFGVSHLAERNYMTLSMGEQRLVLLIRAFVKCPDLLILDEPFHGLDINNRSRAQRIIDLYMRHKGKTLIMVTHYENELPQCIDHCLVLKKHA